MIQWYEYLVAALPAIIASVSSTSIGIFVIKLVKDFIADHKADKRIDEVIKQNQVLSSENQALRKDIQKLTEAITKVREAQNEEQK